MTEAQLQLLTDSLDAIHLEVAAARRSSSWTFALFVLSVLLPLLAAVWLIIRAQGAALDHDAAVRCLVDAGYSPEVLQAYLESAPARPQLIGTSSAPEQLPQHVSHRRCRRRRRRRRRRERRPLDGDDPAARD